MKNILFIILSAVFFLGCDRDKNKTIELTEGTPTTQKVYANETLKTNAIKFSAKENWQVSVSFNETDNDWLKLDKYKGEAGNHSLSLSLTENKTGVARHAEIRIDCGGKSVSISVEQTNTEKSEEPNTPQFKRYVKKITSENADYKQEFIFEYSTDMRISSILNIFSEEGITAKSLVKLEYKGNKIIGMMYDVEQGTPVLQGELFEISLNAKGYAERVLMSDETNMITESSYDANGHITKMTQYEENKKEETSRNYIFTWSNENLTKILWQKEGSEAVFSPYDVISYSTHPNSASCNLDLNIFFGGTEWFDILFQVSGILNLNGKSSKNLPETAASWYRNNDTMKEGYRVNYTYSFDQEAYITECQSVHLSNNVAPTVVYDDSRKTIYKVEYVNK